MANFDSAAGRDELARNGDAQRPHERRVLHAELLGERDEHVMDGIIRPRGKALELGQDLIEHVERDLAVGLGLLVRVELDAVLGESIEEVDLFGNIGELFAAGL